MQNKDNYANSALITSQDITWPGNRHSPAPTTNIPTNTAHYWNCDIWLTFWLWSKTPHIPLWSNMWNASEGPTPAKAQWMWDWFPRMRYQNHFHSQANQSLQIWAVIFNRFSNCSLLLLFLISQWTLTCPGIETASLNFMWWTLVMQPPHVQAQLSWNKVNLLFGCTLFIMHLINITE